ncbi:MAG: O-antigen ligase family protein [Balneolales bacterium]
MMLDTIIDKITIVEYNEEDILKQGIRKKNVFVIVLILATSTYFALVPSLDFIPSLGAYNTQRVLQIGVLAGTALLIITHSKCLSLWLTTWFTLPVIVRWALSAILILGILSSITTMDTRYALLEVGVFTLLFVFAMAVASFYRQFPQLGNNIIFFTFLLCAFLYLVKFSTSYLTYLLVDGAVLWPAGEMVLGFSHVRYFNHIQTLTIPILISAALLLPPQYIILKWFITALTAAWWMLVFGADARATVIASIFSICCVILLYRKTVLSWLKLQLLSCATGFSCYMLLFRVDGGQVSGDFIRYGDSGRLNMWQNAASLITQDPVLGAGPIHYAHVANNFHFTHPHNTYLQFAAEWGVPAFLILCAIGLYGCFAWLKQNHEIFKKKPEAKPKLIRIGLTASLIAGLAHAFVSGLMVAPMSQLIVALITGWIFGVYITEQKSISVDFQGSHRWVLRGFLAAVITFMVLNTYTEVVVLEEKLETYYAEHHIQFLGPRFWRQGKMGFD